MPPKWKWYPREMEFFSTLEKAGIGAIYALSRNDREPIPLKCPPSLPRNGI